MTEWKMLIRMLLRAPKRSIGTKLFLIFFCFLSVSVAVLGLVSSGIAKTALIEQTQKSSLSSISLAGEKLDMKQQFYVDISNQLISNSSFTKNLFQITNPGLSQDELNRRISEIRGLLDQLALSDPHIRNITLFPVEDPLMKPISTEREGAEKTPDSPWVKEVKAANGNPVWLPIEGQGYLGNSPKALFAYGRVLGKSNIGSHDFILLVQVEAKVLQSMVQALKLSDGAETVITTSEGKTVQSSSENSVVSLVELPVTSELTGVYTHVGQDGIERLVTYRKSKISNWSFVGIAPLHELTGAVKQIQFTSYVFVAGNIFIALLIGLWIVLMVGKPLSKMQELMKLAADGNLTGRLSSRGDDEIAQVAYAYNQMMEQISHLVLETRETVREVTDSSIQISSSAEQTAQSSREIHIAADQISQGAVNLAENAEMGTRRMEQVGGRLTEAFEYQGQMAASAQEVDQVCRNGGNTMELLISKTADTEAYFRQVADRVLKLQEASSSVKSFLKLMTEMANQTKILSLNASIEATRAGLAGAGFKVISNEIRQLAERSNSSIGQVADLTESIHVEVQSTVSAMTKAFPFFQDMIREVHAVHELFLQIQKQMDGVLRSSSNVTMSLSQLDETQIMLSHSMSEVSAVSQESSAATEEVASLCAAQLVIGEQLVELSTRMNAVSAKLESHMARFQIDDTNTL
jgi:methyl-accepting chemotaxis protein